jgi:signal peptidase II
MQGEGGGAVALSPLKRLEPWLIAAVLLVLDFASKRMVLAHADALRFERLEVLGSWLRFAYVRNPGAAMGLFPVNRWTLIAVSVLASVFLISLLLTARPVHRLRRVAMGMILGGAIGNLIDRVFYNGLVVDFVDIGIGVHRFYTFNVADIGVTVGGALLFLSLLGEEYQGRRRGNVAEVDHG